MTISPEKFAESQKATIESLINLSTTAMASAEKLTALNLNTARAMIEDSMASMKALSEIKDPQGLMSLQQSLAQPSTEKLMEYYRNVFEIATENREEMNKLIEGKLAEANASVHAMLDEMAKNAPGSDAAVSAVKQALAAANTTYENMTEATRKVIDIAESNLKTASAPAPKTTRRSKNA